MDFSRTNGMPEKRVTKLSILLSFVSINTFIAGTLGLALCFLALLTDTYDPWLPSAFVVSLILLGVGYTTVKMSARKRN